MSHVQMWGFSELLRIHSSFHAMSTSERLLLLNTYSIRTLSSIMMHRPWAISHQLATTNHRWSGMDYRIFSDRHRRTNVQHETAGLRHCIISQDVRSDGVLNSNHQASNPNPNIIETLGARGILNNIQKSIEKVLICNVSALLFECFYTLCLLGRCSHCIVMVQHRPGLA